MVGKNALDRPSITANGWENVSDSVELRESWGWKKYAYNLLHLEISADLNDAVIDVGLQPL